MRRAARVLAHVTMPAPAASFRVLRCVSRVPSLVSASPTSSCSSSSSLSSPLSRLSLLASSSCPVSSSSSSLHSRAFASSAPTAAATTTTTTTPPQSTVAPGQRVMLVYGGAGALGRSFVKHFRADGWHTISVDYKENPESDTQASLDVANNWQDNALAVIKRVNSLGVKVDAVIHAAGGWVGAPLNTTAFFRNADHMWDFNVRSALAAAHVASALLSPKGLLVFTGASAAINPTPGMLEYGVSKAAVHHLARSLASKKSGLPEEAKVITILPITIDTPSNRSAMPDADVGTWTSPDEFATRVLAWAKEPSSAENGGFYRFKTAAGATTVQTLPAKA